MAHNPPYRSDAEIRLEQVVKGLSDLERHTYNCGTCLGKTDADDYRNHLFWLVAQIRKTSLRGMRLDDPMDPLGNAGTPDDPCS